LGTGSCTTFKTLALPAPSKLDCFSSVRRHSPQGVSLDTLGDTAASPCFDEGSGQDSKGTPFLKLADSTEESLGPIQGVGACARNFS
jgi:hypothetical protein